MFTLTRCFYSGFFNLNKNMAAQHFYINEDMYYKYYQNHINCIIITVDECNKANIKDWDTAILHCVYKTCEIDKGRYLSPIYKTITHTLDTYSINGIQNDSILICLR